MTLNGRYALCCRKDAFFGDRHKNLNDRQKCRPMILVSGGGPIRFMRIFARVPWGGDQMTVGLSTTLHAFFAGFFLETLRDEVSIIS